MSVLLELGVVNEWAYLDVYVDKERKRCTLLNKASMYEYMPRVAENSIVPRHKFSQRYKSDF